MGIDPEKKWLAEFLEYKKEQRTNPDPRVVTKSFRFSQRVVDSLTDWARLLKVSETDIVHEAMVLYHLFTSQTMEHYFACRGVTH